MNSSESYKERLTNRSYMFWLFVVQSFSESGVGHGQTLREDISGNITSPPLREANSSQPFTK